MSLNKTPRSNRLHIAILGRRNAGKSSLINAITRSETALVSPVKGTTTDPVFKAMELLPIGPVVLIDTAGLDDEGELGELRIQKTMDVLNKTDLALLVIDATQGVGDLEQELASKIKQNKTPCIAALNKTDLIDHVTELCDRASAQLGIRCVPVSAVHQQGIREIKKALADAVEVEDEKFRIVGDLISPGDLVVLVVPIDKAAPKGRLILPQQQTIRDILESDAIAVISKEHELKETLEHLRKPPRLVITDSQAFLKAAADTPKSVPLTSFSILFARHKGNLSELVKGAKAIERLKDGDRILIGEACTHHQQSDDIGSVKIPRWLRQVTGKRLEFDQASGFQFPPNLRDYALIVHCGACMLNRRSMLYRIEQATLAGVPIVNYGILIAYVQGIFPRAIELFPSAFAEWEE